MIHLSNTVFHKEELVINVTGTRESKASGIQEGTREFVREFISMEQLSQSIINSLSEAAKRHRENMSQSPNRISGFI